MRKLQSTLAGAIQSFGSSSSSSSITASSGKLLAQSDIAPLLHQSRICFKRPRRNQGICFAGAALLTRADCYVRPIADLGTLTLS